MYRWSIVFIFFKTFSLKSHTTRISRKIGKGEWCNKTNPEDLYCQRKLCQHLFSFHFLYLNTPFSVSENIGLLLLEQITAWSPTSKGIADGMGKIVMGSIDYCIIVQHISSLSSKGQNCYWLLRQKPLSFGPYICYACIQLGDIFPIYQQDYVICADRLDNTIWLFKWMINWLMRKKIQIILHSTFPVH